MSSVFNQSKAPQQKNSDWPGHINKEIHESGLEILYEIIKLGVTVSEMFKGFTHLLSSVRACNNLRDVRNYILKDPSKFGTVRYYNSVYL